MRRLSSFAAIRVKTKASLGIRRVVLVYYLFCDSSSFS
jgi:hypothetical protein